MVVGRSTKVRSGSDGNRGNFMHISKALHTGDTNRCSFAHTWKGRSGGDGSLENSSDSRKNPVRTVLEMECR